LPPTFYTDDRQGRLQGLARKDLPVWHSLSTRLWEGGAVAGFLGLDAPFSGRYFDREIIIQCVRWYLRFKLSFRDLVEMMAHTTIMRWVRHYAPAFGRRWKRFACPAGAVMANG
jgi:hypothetical protein